MIGKRTIKWLQKEINKNMAPRNFTILQNFDDDTYYFEGKIYKTLEELKAVNGITEEDRIMIIACFRGDEDNPFYLGDK